jgi:hypothetical protein
MSPQVGLSAISDGRSDDKQNTGWAHPSMQGQMQTFVQDEEGSRGNVALRSLLLRSSLDEALARAANQITLSGRTPSPGRRSEARRTHEQVNRRSEVSGTARFLATLPPSTAQCVDAHSAGTCNENLERTHMACLVAANSNCGGLYRDGLQLRYAKSADVTRF